MDDALFDPASETLEDLGRAGMRLIQPARGFRYGTDSVLLADFAAACPGGKAVDLGAGCGVIAILLAARRPELSADCVELQEEPFRICQRNIALNGLTGRIRAVHADLREAAAELGYERYDFAVSNPPYFDAGTALPPERMSGRTARHDGMCTPAELCRAAFRLVRNGGRFCVVYPAARAEELLRAMEDARFAPKRIRCVQDTAIAAPKRILLEGIKNGGMGLQWLAPLLLRNGDGSASEEYRRIYAMD